MSLLDRVRPLPTSARSAPGVRASAFLPGVVAGVRAAGISLVVILVPLLAGWATARDVTASWTQALRVTADGWLLIHHVAIAYPGGQLGLTPLALTAVPALAIYRSARRLAADPTVGEGFSTDSLGWRVLGVGLAGLVVGYAALAVAIALVSRSGSAHAVLWQAALASAVIALLAGGAGLLRAHPRSTDLTAAAGARVPARLRSALRPALAVVTVLLVAAVLLTVVALVLGGSRVAALHRALQPGVAGGLLLILGEVGYLPVLAAWSLSWLIGPGFAVGAGSIVSPGSVHVGVLPVVPVLGALPAGPLPSPAAVWAIVAVPVLAGAVGGWWSARRVRPIEATVAGPLVDRLAEAALTALVAAVLLTALLALSAGPIGPGRLHVVGPNVLLAGPILLAELAAGALISAAIVHVWTGRRPT